jgi:Tetracyclin repressor-like, C-terminal domain
MRTMGEITRDPALLDLYRQHLLRPRIGQIRILLDRARDRNEIDRSVSAEVAAAMIAAPLMTYYLTLLAEPEVIWPDNLAEEFTRRVLLGICSHEKERPGQRHAGAEVTACPCPRSRRPNRAMILPAL